MSEELNKTAVKPSRRERRWQVKSFFFPASLFFLASSCTLASKHPLLRYRLGVIASEQSGEAGVGEEGGGSTLRQVGSCYYQSEMTIKRPLTLPALPVAFTVPVTG